MYYVLLQPGVDRDRVLVQLKQSGIHSVFHYVPLHSSPAGRRYGRAAGSLTVTDLASDRLIRLPLWVGLSPADVGRVVQALSEALAGTGAARARGT
jgi:dTDP-4-amino-4,6-dideoxygalactose transaminase